MAENKDGKGSLDVGFFYYDWALSRYRWMDSNCFTKVSGFGPVKKMACSSLEVKAQVGCHCNSVMLKSNENGRQVIFFRKIHDSGKNCQ